MTTTVPLDNQFDALQDDSKTQSTSRKDDIKEQAYQAKQQIKGKAADIKEQVVSSTLFQGVSQQLQSGLEYAKGQVANLAGDPSLAQKPTAEVASDLKESAEGEWETVKRRGRAQVRKAEDALDEQLTDEQKVKLQKGVRQAKQAGRQGVRGAKGLVGRALAGPRLRPVRTFIERNNLQIPVLLLTAILGLYLSLSLIRYITAPDVPEFDIHSPEASMNWLKFHAGEYKDKAIDMKDSLPARVAKFLANHKVDQLKTDAMERADVWRDIGMKRLGLAEPTMSQRMWSYVTGRPLTWQGRVENVLDLASKGIRAAALKKGLQAGANSIKDSLGMNEPTLTERVRNYVTGHDPSLSGRVTESAGGVMDSIRDTLNSVRSHLPGTPEIVQPPSTLDNIKSGAEYIKNRVVHGAQEAVHVAQDRANEVIDRTKYKTGL